MGPEFELGMAFAHLVGGSIVGVVVARTEQPLAMGQDARLQIGDVFRDLVIVRDFRIAGEVIEYGVERLSRIGHQAWLETAHAFDHVFVDTEEFALQFALFDRNTRCSRHGRM